jgi:hypothetical protein
MFINELTNNEYRGQREERTYQFWKKWNPKDR